MVKILSIHIKLLNMNDFIEPSSSQWVWYLSPVVLVLKKGRSTYFCCPSHCVDYQWHNVTIVKDFHPSAFLNRWLHWDFVHFLLVQHLEPCQWIKDGRLGVACISLLSCLLDCALLCIHTFRQEPHGTCAGWTSIRSVFPLSWWHH